MKKIFALLIALTIFFSFSITTLAASTWDLGQTGARPYWLGNDGIEYNVLVSIDSSTNYAQNSKRCTLYLYETDDYIYFLGSILDNPKVVAFNGTKMAVTPYGSKYTGYRITKGTTSFGMNWRNLDLFQHRVLDYVESGNSPDTQDGVMIINSLEASYGSGTSFYDDNWESDPDNNAGAGGGGSLDDDHRTFLQKILDGITNGFNAVINALVAVKDFIVSIPENVVNLLKEIFIPNSEDINEIWTDMTDQIKKKFNVVVFDFSNLFGNAKKPDDIVASYKIYGRTYKLTFADFSFLETGVDYFRPFIRGFIALLAVFYNINQALNTFGMSYGDRGSGGGGNTLAIEDKSKGRGGA